MDSAMNLKVLKNDSDHEAALVQAERLVEVDPVAGSSDADRLEVLSLLIEDYEKKRFPLEAPTPMSAILFRMEESGLRQRDLVPMIGSRSRVSEVLSGKRPLTVPMIRALSDGLGISADLLVAEKKGPTPSQGEALDNAIDWSRFPVKQMHQRGWFGLARITKKNAEEIVRAFVERVSSQANCALYRRRFHGQGLSEKSRYSLLAWTARVLVRAKEEGTDIGPFDPMRITSEDLKELARLSVFESGPRLAVEFLAKRGITVIIEPRLPNSLLDGAALLTEQRNAVIGLTLRYDRVDAFWFTLFHELIHVWRHLSSATEAFVDRLESLSDDDDYREKEANRLAQESLIPRAVWRRSAAFLAPTRESVQRLADDLHIHPGIVVGRLHHETGNYKTFVEFLRHGSVRSQFPDVSFE
jgi:HTH-type transcriptional regulator/antitoxin HigA